MAKPQIVISCPICSHPGSFSFISKKEKKIYNCTNDSCDHFWTTISKENQGMHPRDYDIKKFSNKNLKFYGKRNLKLLRMFLNNIPNAEKYNFLDYGTGVAHVARSFKNKLRSRVNLFCFEPNERCSKFYKEWGLVHKKTISDIDEKFDLIYSLEVIEHIENPYIFLKEIKSLLKPDGKFFLTTPAGCKNEESTNAFDNYTHIHFFTPYSLNLLLKKSGFKEIEFKLISELIPEPSKKRKIFNFFVNLINLFKIAQEKNNNVTNKNYDFNYSKYDTKALKYPFHLTGFTSHLS